ncbi:MAG: Zn-ribbon domain-containing OB-fold protein [Alphaproteobacteria bacterium]
MSGPGSDAKDGGAMPSFPRPLPQVDGDAAPYWRALARGVVEIQRCAACRRHVFPPRPFCPRCLGRDVAWEEVDARGRVATFTAVHRPTHPWFMGVAPYVYALVELPCGVRLPTRLVDVRPEDVVVGLPVEPRFERVADDVTLLHFAPRAPG